MAKLTKFLGQVVGGVFGTDGDMRDYQHAARLFTDNYMALAPKVEFLYHVFFDINQSAVRTPTGSIGWSKMEPRIEAGMLVKACQVPGVQINTETKNQYGKKTNIQTQVQYTPINITFHDDNTNLISGMWQQYFKTYYADSNYPEDLARQPTYNSPSRSTPPGRGPSPASLKLIRQGPYSFGFNDYQTGHFFNKISIYQLSRHNFYEYTLINPIITSWQGPQLNSSSSNPAENQMTIIYEGIKYAQGRVDRNNPKGFAQLHYDTSPSPLSIMGGGSASLFGSTGVLAGGLDVFGDLLDPNVYSNPFALIGTAIKAKNTIDNAKQLTRQGVRNEITSIATGALTNTIENTVRVEGLNKTDQTNASLATLEVGQVANTPEIQGKVKSIEDRVVVTEVNDNGVITTTTADQRIITTGGGILGTGILSNFAPNQEFTLTTKSTVTTRPVTK